MKIVILIIFSLALRKPSYGQQSIWRNSTEWQVYDVANAKIWQVSIDSLTCFKSKRLNTDSIQAFLSETETLTIQYSPAWMGAYLATCMLDNKKRKVIISTYGGFFYDQSTGKYFQVPLSIQKDWLNYWASSVASLQTSK